MDWLTHHYGLNPPLTWQIEFAGISAGGRALYLAVIALALLLLTAPVALLVGGEVRTRWLTWALILPVIGIPLWLGRITTTIVATLLAVVAVIEYSRLTSLRRLDTAWLLASALIIPLATLAIPATAEGFPQASTSIAWWVPWFVLGGAAIPLLGSDTVDGFRRAAMSAFAVVWLCWSLANVPLLGKDAFVVLFAAACADIGAFVGGKGLRRFRWARRKLTPLSPNKTWGGVAGAFITAAVVLALCGSLSVGWLLAIWLGGIAGDLLESMVKRTYHVKDAGDWLPGFGGLLDRIDSLLIAVPLAVLFA